MRADCFAFIVFWMSCQFFLMVPWVGLQFVIVVFPDHTHLLFEPSPCFTGMSAYDVVM